MLVPQFRCLDDKFKPLAWNTACPRFKELVASIKDKGLLIPIFIDAQDRIVSGHIRFLAAIEAGLIDLPFVRVKNIGEVNYARCA